MRAVALGDVDKLGVLFERHKTMLFKFFYNISQDAALSEDMVQNVFMRILQYRERFGGQGEFRHWMFNVSAPSRLKAVHLQTFNPQRSLPRQSTEHCPQIPLMAK